MYNPERIARLFMLYTLGNLTPAEESELKAWRLESPRNEEVFQYETNPDNIALTYNDIAEKREPIFRKIKEAYPKPWEGKVRNLWPHIHIPRKLEVAIYIVLFSVGGYFIYNKWDKTRIKPGSYEANILSFDGVDQAVEDLGRGFSEGFSGVKADEDQFGNRIFRTANDSTASKDKYNVIYTPRGGYHDLRLPDGSLVILNAASTIRYPANYNRDTIHLELNGEAYFEVKRDSLHPMVIRLTHNSKTSGSYFNGPDTSTEFYEIEVSRSRFNMYFYNEEPYMTTTMLEGNAMVHFGPRESTTKTSITTGEFGTTYKNKFLLTGQTDTSETVAWKNGRFYFKNTGIQLIMNAVSRWYNVPLSYHDSIPDRPFNLDVSRDASIHEVFKSLDAQGVYCDLEDGRLHVRNTLPK